MFVKRLLSEGSPLAYFPPSLCFIEGLPDQSGGAGVGGPAAPEITDTRSAAAALEGLLVFGEGSGESAPAGTETEDSGGEPDAGSRETATTGEEEGHTEAQPTAAAPIEPPKSWSAEDRALFSKLPPEAQAVVSRRESEREAQFTRRAQEIADERKGFESERAAMQQHRSQYLTSLQQLVAVALPEAAQFQNVDWAKLSAENPAEFVRLQGLRESAQSRVRAIAAEMQRVQQAQAQEQHQAVQRHLVAEREKLVAAVPEFGDPAKAPAFAKDLGSWLGRQGFSEQEIGSAMDHRLISLAVKAMRADQAEAARTSAAAKKANPPPRVQQPGTTAAPDQGNGKVREAAGRFGRSGSVRDAAALLENFL